MGLTEVEIEVGNPADLTRLEKVTLLVDSGAIYSVVPEAVLEDLGIKPLSEGYYFLANGEKIVRRRGVAVFRYGERVGGSDVLFGEEGDSSLLGATTLESLGLALNPLTRELKPIKLILASSE